MAAADFFLKRVGSKRGKQGTAAGKNTKEGAQQGTAGNGRRGLCLLYTSPSPRDMRICNGIARFALGQIYDNFRESEQAHRNGDEIDAVLEFGNAEIETEGSGVDVRADDTEKKT